MRNIVAPEKNRFSQAVLQRIGINGAHSKANNAAVRFRGRKGDLLSVVMEFVMSNKSSEQFVESGASWLVKYEWLVAWKVIWPEYGGWSHVLVSA